LPPELRAALDRAAHGLSRKEMSAHAATISATYRSGGGSTVIRDADGALAYAFARMPATYAAVAACLQEIAQIDPDYEPASLLDVGAGPGTATWVAADTFSSIAAFVALDANAALRTLALELMQDEARFTTLRYEAGDARKALATATGADLVIASYIMGELPEREQTGFTEALWAATRNLLLVVEPGTPAGYGRIVALRGRLIAAGAHVLAPCPHDVACPLASPDWCHFSQRLARSRDHKQVKGAELPFEDEKFAYVALSRTPTAHRPAARVLAQPLVGKVEVTAKLCTADGHAAMTKTQRRDKEHFSQARRWRWGDAIS
jgi:ribosomal protein RSM22 (predicted rRNA methylase)